MVSRFRVLGGEMKFQQLGTRFKIQGVLLGDIGLDCDGLARVQCR